MKVRGGAKSIISAAIVIFVSLATAGCATTRTFPDRVQLRDLRSTQERIAIVDRRAPEARTFREVESMGTYRFFADDAIEPSPLDLLRSRLATVLPEVYRNTPVELMRMDIGYLRRTSKETFAPRAPINIRQDAPAEVQEALGRALLEKMGVTVTVNSDAAVANIELRVGGYDLSTAQVILMFGDTPSSEFVERALAEAIAILASRIDGMRYWDQPFKKDIAAIAAVDGRLTPQTREYLTKARAGDARAQFMLGAAYDSGTGAPRDAAEAEKWYRASADQGYAEAQNSLGSAFQGEKKYAEALPWYEKASAQNHARATSNLAYLYDLGLGVPQDRKRGFDLYSKAADLGWAEAMWNIANMYGAGQLGNPDPVLACVWALRAKKFAGPNERQVHSELARVIPRLEMILSPEGLTRCKEEAESWNPKAG